MLFPGSSLGDYYSRGQPCQGKPPQAGSEAYTGHHCFPSCLALCPLPSLNPPSLPPHKTSDESHTGVEKVIGKYQGLGGA